VRVSGLGAQRGSLGCAAGAPTCRLLSRPAARHRSGWARQTRASCAPRCTLSAAEW